MDLFCFEEVILVNYIVIFIESHYPDERFFFVEESVWFGLPQEDVSFIVYHTKHLRTVFELCKVESFSSLVVVKAKYSAIVIGSFDFL